VLKLEIFPWNDNFKTGIALIDEQHQKLIGLINSLASIATSQFHRSDVRQALDELIAYTQYHFRAEEKIMLEVFGDHRSATAHLHAHHSFEKKVDELRDSLASDTKAEVIEDMLCFLVQWLALHILESDMKMSKVVQGVKRGLGFADAEKHAEQEMHHSTEVLINTVMRMYKDLSVTSLHFMQEKTEREQAEFKLKLASKVLEQTSEAIFIINSTGHIVEANPSFKKMSGCLDDSVIGKPVHTFHPVLEKGNELWKEITLQGCWSGETDAHQNGVIQKKWLSITAMKDDSDMLNHYVGVFSNVSALLDRQQELHDLAMHDLLTGLPNRLLLLDRLGQGLAKLRRDRDRNLAVMFIDLDGFKHINDSYGHKAGDEVLRETSRRLKQCVRGTDTVVRLGGDEFVVVLTELCSEDGIHPTISKILNAVNQPVHFEGDSLSVSLSIGVAMSPAHSEKADQLLLFADQAMYKAKNNGKNQHCLYVSE